MYNERLFYIKIEKQKFISGGKCEKEIYHWYSYYGFYGLNVKNSIDFADIKQRIRNDGNIVYLPYRSITETKPSIRLSYIAATKNERHKDFYKDYNIGEFIYDDYFIPFIEELKKNELYFNNSSCRFSSGNGLNFSRRIEVYLNRSLMKDEIIHIREKSDSSFVIGNPKDFHSITNFIYNEMDEYEIKIIFDEEQTDRDLEVFCQKYGIDSFDYDKKLYNLESMEVYYFRNTISPDKLNPARCKSLFISKDLRLILKEYESNDFILFIDDEPPFKIIEQREISESDFLAIRQVISNNDILKIANDLGFADYEFDRFCFIGVDTGDELYFCGGQAPYSDNRRFNNIRVEILKILNVDFDSK